MLALFTMGEGWHNNHHACQSSARQGFRWWEVDVTFYILQILSWLGIVWDLKKPPKKVLRNEQDLSSRVIRRTAEQLARHFNLERIGSSNKSSDLSVQNALGLSRHRSDLKEPYTPTREQLRAQAEEMFAKTRSLEDIVDYAYELSAASGMAVQLPPGH
jgi:stearoyl-CoA desaturase (delta-9 desaturase)